MFWQEIGIVPTLNQIKDFTGSIPVLTTKIKINNNLMIEKDETLSVKVDMTYTEGRFNFRLSTSKEINPVMMRAILAGGLSLIHI